MTSTILWSGSAIALAVSLSLSFSAAAGTHGKPAKPSPTPESNSNTIVKTGYGMLRGYVDDQVLVWKGVPYAQPPVGELRWRAPQPPEPWTGVRDATTSASECTQARTTVEWVRTKEAIGSEDCLYMDIYRPREPAYHNEKLPVYVWIHGGSNNFGAANGYDGSILAERSDMVVVVIQYRLGPLGWFYHPDVQTGGVDKLSDSGNFGTLDHARALTWIKNNIGAFGGDPNNVTITGESAGAHNVMNMVISPLGKGLFQRAMSQSGGMTTDTPEEAQALAEKTIEDVIRYRGDDEKAGLSASDLREQMDQNGTLDAYLRGVAAKDFYMAILEYGGLSTYDGIKDGHVLPAGGWIPAIKSGNYNQVPIILGANKHETKPFMPLYGPVVKLLLGQPSGAYSWHALRDVVKEDTSLTLEDVLPTEVDREVYDLAGYYGSRNWRAKFVDTIAHELSQQQDSVYAYEFDWGGEGSGPAPVDFIYGAGHSGEIPFFMGLGSIPSWGDNGIFGYPVVDANRAGAEDLEAAMMRYLAQFARTGNPNGPFTCGSTCLPTWEPWTNLENAPKMINFDADFTQARIEMVTEELTIESVDAEREAAISHLTDQQKGAIRLFRWQEAW